MSQSNQGGAGRREVAWRVFAAEYDDADFDYSESDEERAPNYVVTPTGARINRLFVVGVLTQVEQVSDDVLRGRVVDPTGAFVLYAGQYQPDEMAFLENADPPAFVAVTGKARTFQPEDSDRVFTSIRPESINRVDAETRDRWVVQTAEQTLWRASTFADAIDSGRRGDDLRAALEASGVDSGLASGIPLALDHYGTTKGYLAAVWDLAVDSARVVAGEIDADDVGQLELAPDEGGDAVDVALDFSPTDAEERDLAALETEAVPATAESSEEVAADAQAATATETGTTTSDAETATATETETTAEAATDPDAEPTTSEAEPTTPEAETTTSEAEPTTPEAETTTSEAEPTTSEAETTASDDLGEVPTSSVDETPSETEAETVPEPEAETESEVEAETESEVEAETETETEAERETTTDESVASETDGEGPDIGTAGAGDEMYEFDEEERQEVEEEYGLEFSSGSEVESPEESDLEPPESQLEGEPGDADQHAEPTAEATETDERQEVESASGVSEEVVDDADEAPAGGDTGATEAPGASIGEETTAEQAVAQAEGEHEAAGEEADEAETDSDEKETPENLEDAVMDEMSELDEGDGVERETLMAAVVQAYDVTPADVEDALEAALMAGRCYESGEDTLKPI